MVPNAPLLFRGGLVHQGDGLPPVRQDVLVHGTSVTRGHDLARPEGTRVIPLEGLCLSPGWIDLHTHVFQNSGVFSVAPSAIGLASGVTTLVDAGSAGAFHYRSFHEGVIRSAAETVLAYANVSNAGIVHGHAGRDGFVGDHCHASLHDLRPALALRDTFASSLVGWKARLSVVLADNNPALERQAFERLCELRRQTGLPLMVHHVKSSVSPQDVLEALQEGDVYTHLYHGYEDAIFDAATGQPLPAALEARARGVVFDVGHGSGAFSWDCAEKACDQGFWPDTISTDLHRYNTFWPVIDLATTMTKFLALGLSEEKVIAAVTGQASRALGRPAAPADLTIFAMEEGSFPLSDSRGEFRTSDRRFLPLAVLKNGEILPCTGFPASAYTAGDFARGLQNAAAF